MPAPNLGTLAAPMPGQDAGAAGAPDQGAVPQTPPPATGQEPAAGKTALAKSKVSIAMSMLNATLSDFQPGTREHKAVMEVIRKLSKEFSGAGSAKELGASEAAMLQSEAGQTGSASLQS